MREYVMRGIISTIQMTRQRFGEGEPSRHVWLGSVAGLSILVAGCDPYAQYQVHGSESGLFATVGTPSGGGAWTVCVAEQALANCTPGDSIFHGYRGNDTHIRWLGPFTLEILQAGGEIRKAPPRPQVLVGSHRLTVIVRHSDTPNLDELL